LSTPRSTSACRTSCFTIQLVDGITVYDGRYDIPLSYKQQANRTAKEWETLLEDHRQLSDAWKEKNAERDKLIGKTCAAVSRINLAQQPAADAGFIER